MDNTYRNKWLILGAVSLSLFMGSVDSSIVNVALPTLVTDFNTNFPTIQWVVLAFLLGLSVLMLSVGRLADMIGKKRIFMTGMVIFVIGSALCGLSPSVYALIGARLVQSIGAAMLLALGVAIVTETWPAEERGKALGVSAGVISLGIVVGPDRGRADHRCAELALDLLRQPAAGDPCAVCNLALCAAVASQAQS